MTKQNFDNNILDEINNMNIILTDKDEEYELDLYCYKSCDNQSSNEIKNFRGVVFHKDNIVMKSFPYTDEYNSTELKNIKELNEDFINCKFYDSYEGSLIRLFYWRNKWFISTHRKLNAFKTRWGDSKSFGSLFVSALENEIKNNKNFRKIFPDSDSKEYDILEIFNNSLDKNNQYMFLLKNQGDNIIVCNTPSESCIYHVGTFTKGVLNMDDNINLPHLTSISFSSKEEIKNYIDNINIKKIQGIICLTDTKNFKIFNPSYYELFKLRGNEPSIKYRYLQIRNFPILKNKFYELYPDKVSTFELYENCINNIAIYLFIKYNDRYVNNIITTIPRNEYIIISKCKNWSIKNVNNVVNIDTLIYYINLHPPHYLNQMIKNEIYKIKKNSTSTNTSS